MTKLFNPKMGSQDSLFTIKRDEWLSPFDRLFDEMMSTSNPELQRVFGDSVFEKNAYPKVNIIDIADSVIIEASVPGLKKEDIAIEIDGQILTIASMFEKDSKELKRQSQDGFTFLRREIKKSSFTRSFSLSKDLELSKISADIDSGLLIIKIPKIAPINPPTSKRRVEIGS